MIPELPEIQAVALRVIDVLEGLGVRYHLGGSYASSTHGVPRQTQDIDLVVALSVDQGAAMAAELGEEFYADPVGIARAVEDRSSANIVHLESGVKIDLFVAGDAPFDVEEMSRSQSIPVAPGREVWVKSAEDIVLRKLEWFRQGGETSDRQWGDLHGLVATQAERLDAAYLAKWAEVLGVADLLHQLLDEGV